MYTYTYIAYYLNAHTNSRHFILLIFVWSTWCRYTKIFHFFLISIEPLQSKTWGLSRTEELVHQRSRETSVSSRALLHFFTATSNSSWIWLSETQFPGKFKIDLGTLAESSRDGTKKSIVNDVRLVFATRKREQKNRISARTC